MTIVSRFTMPLRREPTEFLADLESTTDHWPSVEEGGLPSGSSRGSYGVRTPVLRQRDDSYELRLPERGNTNVLAPVLRIRVMDEGGDPVIAGAFRRMPIVILAAGLLIGFGLIGVVAGRFTAGQTDALFWLVLTVLLAGAGILGSWLLGRRDGQLLLAFVDQLAGEAHEDVAET